MVAGLSPTSQLARSPNVGVELRAPGFTARADSTRPPTVGDGRALRRSALAYRGRADQKNGVVGGVAGDLLEAGLRSDVEILADHLRRVGEHRLDDWSRLLGGQLGDGHGLVATDPAQGGLARG